MVGAPAEPPPVLLARRDADGVALRLRPRHFGDDHQRLVALACFWSGAGAGRVPFELLLFFLVSGAVCLLVRSLQRARDRADAARVSREQVLTVVAHDLRAPLATIMVSASSLSRETVDPAVVQSRVKAIDRAVVRMDSLIRDIVDAAASNAASCR